MARRFATRKVYLFDCTPRALPATPSSRPDTRLKFGDNAPAPPGQGNVQTSRLQDDFRRPLHMTEPPVRVVVRRRWNDANSGTTELQHLREPVFKNVPGGICGPLPRPFLFARVWCDHLIDGAALHDCDLDTAPHELELCVLERDNSGTVYAALRRATRR